MTVDIHRDLALLRKLKSRLADIGVRAEIRTHLLSLVIFQSSPLRPISIFIGDSGRSFFCDGGCGSEGRRRWPVTDMLPAAADLAAAVHHPASEPCGSGKGENRD
jgi:hypothetical protein